VLQKVKLLAMETQFTCYKVTSKMGEIKEDGDRHTRLRGRGDHHVEELNNQQSFFFTTIRAGLHSRCEEGTAAMVHNSRCCAPCPAFNHPESKQEQDTCRSSRGLPAQ
jgi:hypothetical protein